MQKSVSSKCLITAVVLALCWGNLAAQTATSKETSDVNELLQARRAAEAKTVAKEWAAAAALWERVVELNPVEVRYWKLLADISYAAKNYRKAIPAYEKVIELGGGYPSNAAYNIACNYALLGEKELALKWLEKAFDMGFRNLPLAQTDKDLESLQNDARFRQIVGLVDTSKMTRTEGWRYDLGLLAREVNRKGFNLFRKISKEEFNDAVKQLNDAIPQLNDIQIVIEMTKLMTKLGDGHSAIAGSPSHPELLQTLPVQFYSFAEGLYIIAADPKYKEFLGAQVLRFGDKTIDEVTTALAPLISRDASPIWIKQRAPYVMRHLPILQGLGLIPETDKVQLTIRDRDGKTRAVMFTADMSQPEIWNVLPNPKTWVNIPQTAPNRMPLYVKNMDVNYWFEYLPESRTVYFQYNKIYDDKQESLAKFSARLSEFINGHEVEKLVIDMRWNNGGNTLVNEPLLKSIVGNQKINQRGKLFIIIGRRVFSAAQNAAAAFEKNTNAIFVGEPTGSSPNFTGDEIFFTLPYSKLSANVSDTYWQYSTPWDYRTWIAPQIYLPPTFAAYSQNRDPVMDSILAYQ